MDKKALLQQLIESLISTLNDLVESANVAKDVATAEESKAENKYDTRGLEASYLAGAQSKRALELQETIYRLQNLKLKDFSDEDVIESTALVTLESSDGLLRHFFLLPVAGGLDLDCGSLKVTTLTVNAPLGRELLNKSLGDEVNIKDVAYAIVAIK